MIDPILFNQKKYTQIDELGRSSTIDTSGNINQQIEKEWKTISKDEISNVGFSEWYAGNLSYQLNNESE